MYILLVMGATQRDREGTSDSRRISIIQPLTRIIDEQTRNILDR